MPWRLGYLNPIKCISFLKCQFLIVVTAQSKLNQSISFIQSVPSTKIHRHTALLAQHIEFEKIVKGNLENVFIWFPFHDSVTREREKQEIFFTTTSFIFILQQSEEEDMALVYWFISLSPFSNNKIQTLILCAQFQRSNCLWIHCMKKWVKKHWSQELVLRTLSRSTDSA